MGCTSFDFHQLKVNRILPRSVGITGYFSMDHFTHPNATDDPNYSDFLSRII